MKKTFLLLASLMTLTGSIAAMNAAPVKSVNRGELTSSGSVTSTSGGYNYGDALSKSIMFYDFQKSGALPANQRNNWRANSTLTDGSDNNVDLTGGLFDAGDHVKFNLPMAYTGTTLAWSYFNNSSEYKTSGQDKYILDVIKWINDYLIKCHPSADTYYYQVGNGGTDHSVWAAAEVIQMSRPSYKIAKGGSGAAVTAAASASLAACATIYKDIDATYAQKCLENAKELYALATSMSSDADYNSPAGGFYTSSCFYDDFSWAGVWLYKATSDKSYLTQAETYSDKWGKQQQTSDFSYDWTYCWDDVHYGAELMLAQLDADNSAKYKKAIENNLDYWTTGLNGNKVGYSPKGLAFLNEWGSLRYSASAAFLASMYADWSGADATKAATYSAFAKTQADYILGSSGRSYLIGFGDNYPKNPHHRTASGVWTNDCAGEPAQSRHLLVGALVGGPDKSDSYEDKRTDYQKNEVADDYNAGLVGLLAKMYQKYGGTPDANLNANETVGEELYIEDAINAQDNTNTINFLEVKAIVYNHTAWPARITKNLDARFYVNISDAIKNGAKASDFTVTSSYAQNGGKVSGLHAYDEANGIYYVDIDLTGANLYPGGRQYCQDEIQFRISAPGKWNYTNSPSYKDLAGTSSNSMSRATKMTLYEGGKLVYGSTPNNDDTNIPVDTTTQTTNKEMAAVKFSNMPSELTVGNTLDLSKYISASPAEAKNITYAFSSNNSDATVNGNILTGIKENSNVTITATATQTIDGKTITKTTTSNIAIKASSSTGGSSSGTELYSVWFNGIWDTDLSVGSTLDMSKYVKFSPDSPTDVKLTFTTTSDAVTFEGNMMTIVKKADNIKITVTATQNYNGTIKTYTNDAQISTSASQGGSSSTDTEMTAVNFSNLPSQVIVGNTLNLSNYVSVSPTNATNVTYSFASDNDAAAISGNTLTAVKVASPVKLTVTASQTVNGTTITKTATANVSIVTSDSGTGGSTSGSTTAEAGDDWLHVVGNKIVDEQGNEVRLTGANWFGFNCSECMLHGLGWGADIRDVLSKSAENGINLMRIPISTQLILSWKNGTPDGQKTNFSNSANYSCNPDLVNADGTSMNSEQVFDKMMSICKEYGIKVMVDIHSDAEDNSGHNYPLWYGQGNITTDQWIEGWVWLVNKFKGDDTFIAADLKNEPHGKRDESQFAKWDGSTDENNWRYAAERCGNAILAINPHMLIVVEGVEQTPATGYTYADAAVKDVSSNYTNYEGAWWGGNLRCVKDYPVTLDETTNHVIYSPHDYGPKVYAQKWFSTGTYDETSIDNDYWNNAWGYIAKEKIAPLLIGEWGGDATDASTKMWMNALVSYMNRYNMSHTFWCINPNSGDTGGLLTNDWKTWDANKLAVLQQALWKDNDSNKYISLDHQVNLGSNGTNVAAYYKETTATGIHTVASETFDTPKNIYDINGCIVRRGATNTVGLSRGIYIMDGKKFVVK